MSKAQFYGLTNDLILDAVEAALGKRATGRVLTLNSLENRVYEIELEEGSPVVAKFYRPNRWNEGQIGEEHAMLFRLQKAEIPVVAPLELKNSKLSKISAEAGVRSLAISKDKIAFAIFPKVRGRLLDELSTQHLQTLGRYLGRIHQIGHHHLLKKRARLTVEAWGKKSLQLLMATSFFDEPMRERYKMIVSPLLQKIELRLKPLPLIAVHGDCHLGNTLWQEDRPFFLDFDDAMMAPAVQDIWMVVRGRDDEARQQREILLAAYEQMCEFDHSSLSAIEALRGLRIIQYSAWIAQRWDDPAFPKAFPQFGSAAYWRSEMEALLEINDLLT